MTDRLDARAFYEGVVLPYRGESCLFWPSATGKPSRARMRMDGKQQIVARVVCIEINGPPPTPQHQAAHSCGNGHLGCVAPMHVSWKTPGENAYDRIRHGTSFSNIDKDDVRDIRARVSRGETMRSVGRIHGISDAAVFNIVHRHSWAWLDDDAYEAIA